MPLDPDDAARLRDIVSFGSKMAAIVAGATQEQFAADSKTLFATCYRHEAANPNFLTFDNMGRRELRLIAHLWLCARGAE